MSKRWFSALLIALLCLQCSFMVAQNSNAIRFEKSNNIILVDIPFNMTDYFVDNEECFILTPVIESDTESLDLLNVILLGKGKPVPETEDGSAKPYAILNTMNRQAFVYQVDVSYQPWMDASSLRLKKVLYSSDGTVKYEQKNIISSNLGHRRTQEVVKPTLTIQKTSPETRTFSSSDYQQVNQQEANSSNSFAKNGDNVLVNIRLRMTDYYVDDYESLVLTPSIQTKSEVLDLQSVILNGKWQARTSVGENLKQPYAIQNVTDRNDITYHINIPYEPWMDNANLKLKRALYNSEGNKDYEISATLSHSLASGMVEGGVQYQQQQAEPIYVSNQENTVSTNSISGQTHDIVFSKKKALSISDLTGNNIALEGVYNEIDSILSNNKNARITLAITVGTCPYGIYMDNENLTKEQALILKSYIQGKYNQYNLDIESNWISEDWTGLTKLIEEDDYFPYKQEVINIINNTGIFKGRERKLMELAGGDAYRYMKAHYFPKLWKADFKINSQQ